MTPEEISQADSSKLFERLKELDKVQNHKHFCTDCLENKPGHVHTDDDWCIMCEAIGEEGEMIMNVLDIRGYDGNIGG